MPDLSKTTALAGRELTVTVDRAGAVYVTVTWIRAKQGSHNPELLPSRL